MFGAFDLVRRLLRHVGCVGPVVLARQHVDGARVGVDVGNARAAVPAAEVEVEIAVEYLVGGYVISEGFWRVLRD